MEIQKKVSVLIRDARSEDLDEVSNLLKDAYQQYALSMPEPHWQAYLADIMDVRSRLQESELIVAEISGHLAGAVTLYLPRKGYSVEDWPEGWAGIRLLGVHPAYRGQGIGRALMEECIERCRKRGITSIGLHTSKLMDVARRMYEKMGFQRVPEFDFIPAPGTIIMAYRLDIQSLPVVSYP